MKIIGRGSRRRRGALQRGRLGAGADQHRAALAAKKDARPAPRTSSTACGPGLAEIVGAQVILQAMQDITIGGRPARAQYQYTLSGR